MKSARLAALASQGIALREAEQLAEMDFVDTEREDKVYDEALTSVRQAIDLDLPVAVVPREYLPNFLFSSALAVVVVGQDGLVANTAKYVQGKPILGVNPDPARYDGVLLPFQPNNIRAALQRVLKQNAKVRSVTLGKVSLNDGQSLLAFNDFFIGCQSHASARYRIESRRSNEIHSSSGVIVSTGAGSTGWLSSVLNMTRGMSATSEDSVKRGKLRWEDRRLIWVVREPFASKHSQADMVTGRIEEGEKLRLESLMSERGVIFSDGMESDAIEFNAGAIAEVTVAREVANLVVS
jgi:hypothetical protein